MPQGAKHLFVNTARQRNNQQISKSRRRIKEFYDNSTKYSTNKNLPIAIINTEEMAQICNIGHTKNKDHDKAGLIRFLPKKKYKSPTYTNKESAQIIMRRVAKKILDSVLGNIITFYW